MWVIIMNNINDYFDDGTIKWIINHIDRQAIIKSIQRLKGSTSSSLYRISIETNQDIRDVVLRKFDHQEWVNEEPDLAYHEAESLKYAYMLNIPTPEIIAFDELGSVCGVPIVLMTMLDGTVQLKPENMDQWINRLADTLTKIHQVSAKYFKWEYFRYNDVDTIEVPTWSSIPKVWEKVIEIGKQQPPTFEECFIHRDYHPANVLYKNQMVTGVVDWVNACKGPAGVDVGHCRLNLALLYNVDTANNFLTAYKNQAGKAFTYDTYWDIVSVIDILFGPPTVYPGWEAFGVTGLTNQMMEERLDNYVQSLVKHEDD